MQKKTVKIQGNVLDAWVRNFNGEGTCHEFFCVYNTEMMDDDGLFNANASFELPLTPDQAKVMGKINEGAKITITVTIEE